MPSKAKRTAPRTMRRAQQKASGQQPEEKHKPATLPQGQSAESDLRLFTPLFPVSTRKRLIYYGYGLSLTGTSGVLAQYVFSANGCYDPDITSGGHQPMGWDQIMLFYEQATVLSSKITVHAAGNGVQPVNVSVSLAPDTTSAVIPDLIENGQIARIVLDGRAAGGYGTGERIKSVSLDCDVAKYFGRPSRREIINDPLLLTTVGANPTEQVYYFVNTWGFGSFTDNTAIGFDVVIEYDVCFWEPRKVAPSLLPVPLTRSVGVAFPKEDQLPPNIPKLSRQGGVYDPRR